MKTNQQIADEIRQKVNELNELVNEANELHLRVTIENTSSNAQRGALLEVKIEEVTMY